MALAKIAASATLAWPREPFLPTAPVPTPNRQEFNMANAVEDCGSSDDGGGGGGKKCAHAQAAAVDDGDDRNGLRGRERKRVRVRRLEDIAQGMDYALVGRKEGRVTTMMTMTGVRVAVSKLSGRSGHSWPVQVVASAVFHTHIYFRIIQ